MPDDPVEYRYVKGQGWVAYDTPGQAYRELRQAAKLFNFGMPGRFIMPEGQTLRELEEWYLNRTIWRR